MKLLISLLFVSTAFAGNMSGKNKSHQGNQNKSGTQNVQYCNMPKEIKVINKCKPVVTQKIVYRDRPCRKKCKRCKTKVKYRTKTIRKTVYKKRPYLKNSIRLLGGYGPNGVSAEKVGDRAVAFEDKGGLLGLGYTRRVTESWSVEGNVLSNDTYLLGVGYNF